MDMHYTWKVEILVWHVLPPVCLLMPDCAASSGPHVLYTHPCRASKAAVTWTSKDQAAGVILTEEEELLIPVSTL